MTETKRQLRFQQLRGRVQRERQHAELESETFSWGNYGLTNKWSEIRQRRQVVQIHDRIHDNCIDWKPVCSQNLLVKN